MDEENIRRINQSKKFYSRLQSEVCPDKSKDQHHVLAIAFDYMQNMSLPVIPVQGTFYLRQLNVNSFCIHDVKKNHATLYIYNEGIAKKALMRCVLSFSNTLALS